MIALALFLDLRVALWVGLGVPVSFDDDSAVGEAYRRLARRVIGEADVPMLDFDKSESFWETFKRWMGLAPAQEVAS